MCSFPNLPLSLGICVCGFCFSGITGSEPRVREAAASEARQDIEMLRKFVEDSPACLQLCNSTSLRATVSSHSCSRWFGWSFSGF